jgi:transposase InsO family protein
VRDRDAVYGPDSVARARGLGIETLLTPVRAPRANAIAERMVRTLRNECLDHVIVANEAHLRALLREFTAYYNVDRPHRGLHLESPLVPPADTSAHAGPIRVRPVLGGLHRVYERAA